MSRPIKTRFEPKNPDKYSGNIRNIICRSSWERQFCIFLDTDPRIKKWSSEEIFVVYKNPVDNKFHRYFPDFVVKAKQSDGEIKIYMIEIKPDKQTKPPKKPKRKTKRYINECVVFEINIKKWESAKNFCETQGWEFLILTEKNTRFIK